MKRPVTRDMIIMMLVVVVVVVVVSVRIEGVRERKGIIPLIHNPGARYRMVSVTTMSIYSQRKRPQLAVAICVDPRLV
jgi:hypothetical protein